MKGETKPKSKQPNISALHFLAPDPFRSNRVANDQFLFGGPQFMALLLANVGSLFALSKKQTQLRVLLIGCGHNKIWGWLMPKSPHFALQIQVPSPIAMSRGMLPTTAMPATKAVCFLANPMANFLFSPGESLQPPKQNAIGILLKRLRRSPSRYPPMQVVTQMDVSTAALPIATAALPL